MNFPFHTNMPESFVEFLFLQGTGNGTAPTVLWGQRITVTWLATGRIQVQWPFNPGYLQGLGNQDFRDTTTISNVKGYSANAGVLTNSGANWNLEVDIWNASQTAVDLATTNLLDLAFIFKRTKAS